MHIEFDHRRDQRLAKGPDFVFDLSKPARLRPVQIDKPWGKEIWFTGSEARGESEVIGLTGALPLSAYLALAPQTISANLPLVLLKILVSDPAPGAGELYLEVHRQKAEAYLITGIDPSAWPAARAQLRYGISSRARAQFSDAAALRRALADAAGALEQSPSDPELRARLMAFIGAVPLTVGSRIGIPPGVPHGLPHGVRVVEFQTPTYERLILAASQPVVTQARWDCETAAEVLTIEAAVPDPDQSYPNAAALPDGHRALARFKDFGARVLTLNDRRPTIVLPASRGAAVVLCSQGEVQLGSLTLRTEEAALVPALVLQEGVRLQKCSHAAECVVAAADY